MAYNSFTVWIWFSPYNSLFSKLRQYVDYKEILLNISSVISKKKSKYTQIYFICKLKYDKLNMQDQWVTLKHQADNVEATVHLTGLIGHRQ